MRLFVIRPFETKEGIDFERVHAELIKPAADALAAFGIDVAGSTTGEISAQGNIREDMFRMIVASDLVIADVSIHNANAFYELGIRHALRPAHTFLIRSRTDFKYPFDLETDRYFLYDAADPKARLADLVQALRETLASDVPDSPVFKLLPDLAPHGRGQLVKVPQEFRDDVQLAVAERGRGRLRLFAHEVAACEWNQEGLLLVGEAQFSLGAFNGAAATFEALRAMAPGHPRANLRLGTIYQRLSTMQPSRRDELFAQSEQAIRRVLDASPELAERVDANCLLASNEKTKWSAQFAQAAPAGRAAAALRSPHFKATLEAYLTASALQLNAHYAVVNALAMLKVQAALAALAPDTWEGGYDTSEQAAAALRERAALADRLGAALALTLNLDPVMGSRIGAADAWLASSRADYLLLTANDRPRRVEDAFGDACAGAPLFRLEATRRNLAVFAGLGVFEPGVSAAIQVVEDAIAAADAGSPVPGRVLLFTGHMVDDVDRPAGKARFPRTAAAEAKARRLIADAVRAEQAGQAGPLLGIAGGACGGDILFHEVCAQAGIATTVHLAMPEAAFQVSSVERGGPAWVDRFRTLTASRPVRVLQQAEALPRWMAARTDYGLWERTNLWMMFSALATDSRDLTLIGLHNPDQRSDGPGGASHLMREARLRGFKMIELDARALLEDA